jgi:hypothetical protein
MIMERQVRINLKIVAFNLTAQEPKRKNTAGIPWRDLAHHHGLYVCELLRGKVKPYNVKLALESQDLSLNMLRATCQLWANHLTSLRSNRETADSGN